ncbi:MAG: PQQ-binding-like beta-propeller repeat protein [Halobacteria archaeon]
MERTTLVIAVLLVAVFGGLFIYAIQGFGSEPEIKEVWATDGSRNTDLNHHEVSAGRVDGETVVAAPVSTTWSNDSGRECSITAYNGSGEVLWRHLVPSDECYIHAIADPAVFDFNDDGTRDVVGVTSEDEVLVFDAVSGGNTFKYNISSDGYGKPISGNLTPAAGNETVVTDLEGVAYAFTSNGSLAWRKDLGDSVLATPVIDDFDRDGKNEVMTGAGIMLSNDGEVEWEDAEGTGSFLYGGQMDNAGPLEVAASGGNILSLVNGTTGERRWNRSFNGTGGVVDGGDADGDGVTELYAGFGNKVYSINSTDGDVVWDSILTSKTDVRTAPPVKGEFTENRTYLAAATRNGKLSIIDPEDGTVLAEQRRDAKIHAYPTAADIDGDGVDEILVIYGDGSVSALSFRPAEN